jgi:uncharacterized protein (TIGR00661 family)
MKILYGVQATGNGHITRSREMINALRKRGISVDVIFSGRDPKKLWGVEDFSPYTAAHGLSFVIKNGKINHLQTAIRQNIFRFFCEIRKLDTKPYDIVITDFEPVSAWAAFFDGKKRIGIGHQYAFFYDIPTSGKTPIDSLVMKTFAPANINIGLHWNNFGLPILPPIIKEMKQTTPIVPRKILVYLVFENLCELRNILKKIPKYDFHMYYDVKEKSDEENIHIKPFSRDGFLRDLHECEAVICNAGFELPSEAIQLGKKILVKPIPGQFEQQSNALAIEKLGLGMVMNILSPDKIAEWMNSPNCKKISFPQTAPVLAEWIEKQDWDSLPQLSESLWSETASK